MKWNLNEKRTTKIIQLPLILEMYVGYINPDLVIPGRTFHSILSIQLLIDLNNRSFIIVYYDGQIFTFRQYRLQYCRHTCWPITMRFARVVLLGRLTNL